MTPAAAKQRWLEMGEEERLAKTAGPWQGGPFITYRTVNGQPFAIAGRTRVDGYYRIGTAPLETVSTNALDLVQAACDAELIRQGYVLENEP